MYPSSTGDSCTASRPAAVHRRVRAAARRHALCPESVVAVVPATVDGPYLFNTMRRLTN